VRSGPTINEDGLFFKSATKDMNYKKMLGCEQTSFEEDQED
jgi:hypothetical protein